MHEPELDHFGPIDFFVVEFADGDPGPAGFAALLELVDAGTIRIIDLELVQRTGDEVRRLDAGSFEDPAVNVFQGASSGLLDDDDLAQLAEDIPDSGTAAVIVYEDLAILAVMGAFETGGATIVSEGHLSVGELVDALDATESA